MATAKPAARKPPRVAFPKKAQTPRPEEFAAQLPLAWGKRFEATRAFLKKQKSVSEELFFYGPKTGWAFRYLRGTQSVCTVMVHEGRPLGILSLTAEARAGIVWKELSPAGQKAHRHAHGSPSLLWLDLPLDGTGATDFREIVRAKLKTMAPLPSPPSRAGG
jgi:hypothetical protein